MLEKKEKRDSKSDTWPAYIQMKDKTWYSQCTLTHVYVFIVNVQCISNIWRISGVFLKGHYNYFELKIVWQSIIEKQDAIDKPCESFLLSILGNKYRLTSVGCCFGNPDSKLPLAMETSPGTN